MARRVPAWVHPQTAWGRSSSGAWRPGWLGTGQLRPVRPRVELYRQLVAGVPLTGGQAQSKVSAGGAATVSVGPQGLGTVWYPAQATISTTTGAADSSTCQIFLGAQGVNNLLVGQSYAGGGDTIALSVPALTPGGLLIAVWSGGHSGDLATVNILGTMDALTI
jgi:hypothetical protein